MRRDNDERHGNTGDQCRDQCADPRRPAASSLPLWWWCSGSPVTSLRAGWSGAACSRRPILGMKMPRSTAATSCHRSRAPADRSNGHPMLRQRPHRSLSDAPAIEETTSRPAGPNGCRSAVKSDHVVPSGSPALGAIRSGPATSVSGSRVPALRRKQDERPRGWRPSFSPKPCTLRITDDPGPNRAWTLAESHRAASAEAVTSPSAPALRRQAAAPQRPLDISALSSFLVAQAPTLSTSSSGALAQALLYGLRELPRRRRKLPERLGDGKHAHPGTGAA